MQGKQAKILSPTHERVILRHLETTRYPWRDRVIFLLSLKAGLRAKEIASLTWGMVTDAAGEIAETLHLENRASKGKKGGRTIPLHADLQEALATLKARRGEEAAHHQPVIFSERGWGLSEASSNCGFIGSIGRLSWPGVRHTPDAAPSLRARRARCRKPGAVCGMCSNSPGMPALP
jgi:integrase/recombinase XerC